MAANDYYRGDEPARYHSPVSDLSTGNDKPLPGQPSPFQPTNTVGYNDDLSYAQTHYSKQSIDTAYDSHAYGSSSYNPTSPNKPEQYQANIPLQDTNTQYPQRPHGAALDDDYDPSHRHSRTKKRKQRPWFCYIISVIQVAVFCWELGRQAQLTGGNPIATKPQFNPMIGPSFEALIDMGARYVPCMKAIPGFTDNPNLSWPCPGRETLEDSNCSIRKICGFGGHNMPKMEDEKVKDSPQDPDGTEHWVFEEPITEPNQWYRFIIPMFLHVGLIHLLFNLFVQITLGGDMERAIGVVRFAIVYFVSGIFGFIFGGNLGSNGQPTVGASGCLFGIFALTLLNILYNWADLESPRKDLAFLLIDIVVSFVLGLLPFIDNFAHIGGFISGIALGIVFMRSPPQLQKRLGGASDPPYTPALASNRYNTSSGTANLEGFTGFVKQPLAFFKGRKPLWWAWWGLRAAMLAVALGAFIGLLTNFYGAEKQCSWCKYLSCLPVNGWCDMFDLQVINGTDTSDNPVNEKFRF